MLTCCTDFLYRVRLHHPLGSSRSLVVSQTNTANTTNCRCGREGETGRLSLLNLPVETRTQDGQDMWSALSTLHLVSGQTSDTAIVKIKISRVRWSHCSSSSSCSPCSQPCSATSPGTTCSTGTSPASNTNSRLS